MCATTRKELYSTNMRIPSRIKRRPVGTQRVLRLLMLVCAVTLICACAVPSKAGVPNPSSPTPSATPEPALTLTVVQTIYNSWSGRQTESVFTETVMNGESYTVKNMSGSWSLTFSLTFLPQQAVTVHTSRPMLPHNEEDAPEPDDTFVIEPGSPFRIDEPTLESAVWYTFTFTDPLAPTPTPEESAVVQFHNRSIVSNIRRTLHESKKSAFTPAELELILFIELKGNGVTDIRELSLLPSMETLTLRNTRVTDLSPLADSESLRTLVLLENDALALSTMPPLPSLTTLSITGKYTKEDILFLETLLPNCSVIAEIER